MNKKTRAVVAVFIVSVVASVASAYTTVTIEIQQPDTSATPRVTKVVGDMSTVIDSAQTLGFSSTVTAPGADVDVYRIVNGVPTYDQTVSITSSAFVSFTVGGRTYGLKLIGDGTVDMRANNCCVTCDGVTACGCKVEHSCGCCYVTPCGPC